MPNIIKVTAKQWLSEAKKALISDGINGVKVDRLSKALGVTRGGFYHHFNNRADLLDGLLEEWKIKNIFLPPITESLQEKDIPSYLDAMIDLHISSRKFSPAFEMAIREWGRIDTSVQRVIDQIDAERISALTSVFILLGYEKLEAEIRARVLYLHQIGYYALRLHSRETKQSRKAVADTYRQILYGPKYKAGSG